MTATAGHQCATCPTIVCPSDAVKGIRRCRVCRKTKRTHQTALSDQVCATCPKILTASQVRLGLKRCIKCRATNPGLVYATRAVRPASKPKVAKSTTNISIRRKVDVNAPVSWWMDHGESSGFTAQAEAQRERMATSRFSVTANPTYA